MKIKVENIIITLASALIGITMSIVAKKNLEIYTPVTLKSMQDTKDEITMINNEIDDLKEIVISKQENLEVFENIAKGEENIIDILKRDNDENKFKSGYTALEGPGVIITMFDNPDDIIVGFDINDDIIHDVDILNILNDLRFAGAEAISINGERVLSTSEIKCSGPVITINQKRVGIPFIIKAIGDPKLLLASVNAPDTYGYVLKNVYQVGFEAKTEDKLHVPGYSRDYNFLYAKPKGEGDI